LRLVILPRGVFVARRRRFVFDAVVFARCAVGQVVEHVDAFDDAHELDVAVGEHVGDFPGFDRLGLGLGFLRSLVDGAADRGAMVDLVAEDGAGGELVFEVDFFGGGRRVVSVCDVGRAGNEEQEREETNNRSMRHGSFLAFVPGWIPDFFIR
jgi:hypothetical protein